MSKSAHAQDKDVSCGIGACKPRWAARLANPKLFLPCWCLVIMTYLSGGSYVVGMLTTMEKRFGLQSRQLGLISSAADVGSMMTVLFVTYYGGKPGVSRPRIIGVGALLLAAAATLSGMTHFITPAYDVSFNSTDNSTNQGPCMANRTVSSCGSEEEKAVSSKGGWLALFLFAQFLYGIGGTPVRPLGTTYIDDQVSRRSAPVYFGISSMVFAIGIPIGFIMGAFVIKYYVDIDKGIDPSEFGLTSDNPLWVGAWWLGLFILAGVLVVVAMPMFFFPAAMKTPENDDDEVEKEEKSTKQRMLPMMDTGRKEPLLDSTRGLFEQLKDMAKSLKDILTNGTFMMLCFSGVCNASVSGAYSFMPKYMEVQFGVPKSRANLLLAPIVLPTMIVGFLASGLIIRRFKLSPRQCVYMSMTVTAVSTLGFVGMFFFTCPVPPMAGVTIPYGYSPYMPNAPQLAAEDANLLSPCNGECSCSTEKYSPVCGMDGVTYFSACHAGCTEGGEDFVHPMGFTLKKYSNCGCLAKLPPEVLMKIAAKFSGGGGKGPGGRPSANGGGGMPGGQRPNNGAGIPGSGGQRPGTGAGMPDSDGQRPGTGAGVPDSGGQRPGNGTGIPDSSGQRPGTGAGMPDSGGQRPGNGTGMPDSSGQRPGTGAGMPDSGGQRPANGEGMPDSGGKRPGIEDGAGIPDSSGQRPGTGAGMPDSGGQRPGTGAGMPDSGGQRPANGEGMPDSGGKRPGTGDGAGIPDSGGQRPTPGAGMPDSGDQRPNTGAGMPDPAGQGSGTADGMPDSGDVRPGNGAGMPGSGGRRPGTGVPGKGPMMPPGMKMPSFAIGAPCPQICGQWKYFLGSFVVVGFLSSFGLIPSIIAVLRSLTPETKSLGMGVQIVFYRLLGFIPSPIYFGVLIDSTCRLWNTTCGERGACLLYDLDLNRYYFLGLMVAFRVLSILCEFVAAQRFKRREELEPEGKKEVVTTNDIASSLGNLAGSIKSLDMAGRDENGTMKDTEDLRMNIWKKRGGEEAKPLA